MVEPLLWDTFIQGHEIWSQKNANIIFVSITSIEGTPLFKEKGHFFGSRNPGLTSIHRHLSNQNVTDHKEGCTLFNESFHKLNYLT